MTKKTEAILSYLAVFLIVANILSIQNILRMREDMLPKAPAVQAPQPVLAAEELPAPATPQKEIPKPIARPVVSPVPRVFTTKVTAFSQFDGCDDPDCIMASGKKAYVGAAACPKKYRFGTKIGIAGLKLTCEDRTGNPDYADRFDIFMGYGEEGYIKAINWGIKRLPVEIYK